MTGVPVLALAGVLDRQLAWGREGTRWSRSGQAPASRRKAKMFRNELRQQFGAAAHIEVAVKRFDILMNRVHGKAEMTGGLLFGISGQ